MNLTTRTRPRPSWRMISVATATRSCRRSSRPRSSPSRPTMRWRRCSPASGRGRSIRAASTRRCAPSRRRSRRSNVPRMRSASAAAWRRSPPRCSRSCGPATASLPCEHVYPDTFRFFETVLKALGVTRRLCRRQRSCRGRGHAARPPHPLPGEPDSWMFQALDLRRAGPHGARRMARSASSTTAGPRRSSRTRSRSAATSPFIPRRNISAAIPMSSPASSPGAAS